MFLLILNLVREIIAWLVYLHSTMFLLIPDRVVLSGFCPAIYIPLCFYLYKSGIALTLIPVWIYIPLCFYLYFDLRLDKHGCSHLHSTMFLLIREFDLHSTLVEHIYIPLCFYLYGQVTRSHRQNFLIYIPLCFYLYRKGVLSGRDNESRFTFHYVSTYTSQSRKRFQSWKLNLHSTMFLLIRVSWQNSS